MLEYWMASNQSGLHDFNATIEEVLQDPGSAILFIGYPLWLRYFAAGCCVLFMLVGIPGNLITMTALFRTKKLRNATAVFIMNLSISDLMFCCFNLPLATSTFWYGTWLYGPLLCRLFPLMRYGLVAVSLFTVLSITINRYVMIGHPRVYSKLYKPKRLISMVLATWALGFGALIITWFGYWGRFGLDTTIGSCSILPDANGHSPKEFLFVLAFVIPCIAIVVCYARIFYIVRKTTSKTGRRDKTNEKMIDVIDSIREQRSVTPKPQEEELSVLGSSCNETTCAPFSKKQEDSLSQRRKSNRVRSKGSLEDTSSGNHVSSEQKSSKEESGNEYRDVKEEKEEDDSLARGNHSTSKKNDHADTKVVGLGKNYEDIPFADDREADIEDGNIFLGNNQRRGKDSHEKSIANARKSLERMASRASFIVESAFWVQRLTGSGEKLERSETFLSSRSNSLGRRSRPKPTIFRRESRFIDIVSESRNIETAPRMSGKDRKLLKMILVIFLSFLICYLPITVTKLFREDIDWRGLNIASYILIYLTTCINPIIYVVMSSEYRSAYKNVLLCRSDSVAIAKTQK